MHHLHKWKIKESPNCQNCGVVESTIHAIYECPIAKDTLRKLETLITRNLGIEIKINQYDCLYGIDRLTHSMVPRKERAFINKALILVKRKLILQREDKVSITDEELSRMIETQTKLESAGATR
jgi:hypothetical protein